MEEQAIVFAYWVNEKLMGFRADTWGTISMTHPKIYHYSEEQVTIVLNNTKNSLSNVGAGLMKFLFKDGAKALNMSGEEIIDGGKQAIDIVSGTEHQLREWNEFELRVHPFIDYEEGYTYPERWKVDVEINNLKDAIEIHKFKLAEYEN